MTIRMLVDALHEEETRVVIADDNNLLEFDIETTGKKQTKGNIYLAKVTRVEPSLQAAFVEYGSARQGFLPFAEIHPDYYQIPVADRQALLREQEEEHKALLKEEEELDAALENEPVQALLNNDGVAAQISDEGSSDEINNSPENQELENDSGNPDVLETAEQQEIPENVEIVESAEKQAVEVLGNDAPFEPPVRRQRPRRYKIQEVIKKNQLVLIQVIKEERGNKGASVTSYISLPGRYCVLMPNSSRGGGVSRKISDSGERRKLKEIMNEIKVKDGMSIILRTAGMNRSKTEITRDYNYLSKLWNTVRESALNSVAPALVYEEANVIKRALRDLYNNEVEEVLIAGDEGFKLGRDFMKMIMPSHSKKIIEYSEKTPIFNKYGVEKHLASMYDPVVTLPSGGYIVINTTEALIAIDVNSGRSTGARSVEDTATRTNIEAAYEVARQLRLRDLAGLVVIDFIDMLDGRHRKQVERALKDALRHDRAKIQVGRISPFGLMEMSRQRLRPSLTEINMHECPTCKGAGVIRSSESMMVQLIRSIENELAITEDRVRKITIASSSDLALYLLNHKRKNITDLEAQYKFELSVSTDATLAAGFKLNIEFENGKSKTISSEDREGARLPQSRESEADRNNRRRDERRAGKDRKREKHEHRNAANGNNSEIKPQQAGQRYYQEQGGITHSEIEPIEFIDSANVPEGGARQAQGQGGENRDRNRHRRRNRNRNRNRNRDRNFPRNNNNPQENNVNGGAEIIEIKENIYTEQSPPIERQVNENKTAKEKKEPKEIREPKKNQGQQSTNRRANKATENSAAETAEGEQSQETKENRRGWWRKIIE